MLLTSKIKTSKEIQIKIITIFIKDRLKHFIFITNILY